MFFLYCDERRLWSLMNKKQFMDYDFVKERLQIRLCDPELNAERLQEAVYSMHGDFAAVYQINLVEKEGRISSIPITVDLMQNWKNVSLKRLHKDALNADKARGITLACIDEVIANAMFFDGEPTANLLETCEQIDTDKLTVPILCLTNKLKVNGAAAILHDDVMAKISNLIGCNYFILPSSINEVLIVPDKDPIELDQLSSMVEEVNMNQVAPDEFLSNKVQYYGKDSRVLENAEKREKRLLFETD